MPSELLFMIGTVNCSAAPDKTIRQALDMTLAIATTAPAARRHSESVVGNATYASLKFLLVSILVPVPTGLTACA